MKQRNKHSSCLQGQCPESTESEWRYGRNGGPTSTYFPKRNYEHSEGPIQGSLDQSNKFWGWKWPTE